MKAASPSTSPKPTAMSTPFATLPVETIVDILRFCSAECSPVMLPTPPTFAETCRTIAGADLSTLSQVCRGFATVIRDTPSLWSTITIDLRCFTHISADDPYHGNKNQAYRADYNVIINLVRRVLELGKDTPITINFVQARDLYPIQLLELVAQSAGRWRDATFYIHPVMLHGLFAVHGNLHRLENLTIVRCLGDVEDLASSLERPLSWFSVAPRLTQVNFPGPLRVGLLHIPVEQLEHLQCSPQYADIPAFLQIATRMGPGSQLNVELHVDWFEDDISNAVHLEGQHFQQRVDSALQNLRITAVHDQSPDYIACSDGSAVGFLLQSLRLPNLDSFELIAAPQTPVPLVWPQDAALGFFGSSSGKNLTTLMLQDVRLSPQQLLAVLHCLPILQDLSFADFVGDDPDDGDDIPALFTDELLHALSQPQGQLVPRLARLMVTSKAAFAEPVLSRFIMQRLRPGQVFTFTLLWVPSFASMFEAELDYAIERWVEAGLLCWESRDFPSYARD
ncbi:hypothetical protein MIND_01410400 [Mycena indigotica]|uniref:F-box domain-containing protein n=1 Tax=Mycena indigotica TaxID=2126181 RepID=A0A8H6S0B8_9AGAR|nr:uncharacterized protein MIND_01410400 [Mycena indigotica]KAF7288940.1 hypothetical protein MIND_01410400 [Mycena indigotica]